VDADYDCLESELRCGSTYSQASNFNFDVNIYATLGQYPILAPPADQNGYVTTGAYQTCTSPYYWSPFTTSVYRYPQQSIRNNQIQQVNGLEFHGSFNGSVSGTNGLLNEAVFFHQEPCYFGGMEYGFRYNPADNGGTIQFYVLNNANCGASSCSTGAEDGDGVDLTVMGVSPGTRYYYEAWIDCGGGCHFVVGVKNDDTSWKIQPFTPSFKSGFQGSFAQSLSYATGYISATTENRATMGTLTGLQLIAADIKIAR
jgi:hypothetical protein